MTAVRTLIDFVAAGPDGERLRHAFGPPREVLVAWQLDEVRPLLDQVQQRSESGCWCVGYLRYEAAPAFDTALQVKALPEGAGPLAWFGVHQQALDWPEAEDSEPLPQDQVLHWSQPLQRAGFDQALGRIHQAIADGEVYQVNYTHRLHSAFSGSAEALFQALRRAQPDAYAACIPAEGETILSVSPELFFDWREGRLLSRPMKGTAARGMGAEDDAEQARQLRHSPKEQAENLMIVDLIRNDLSRLAEPFSVEVPHLFDTRAWPTVWQMTSDVQARTRPGTTLAQVFEALFPCGSVTGAPKVRAMHWIQALEAAPRGVYCGAIGVVQPGGAATFNVGIRSLTLAGGQAECGIGSGITTDARAAGEWREWSQKRAFLERASAPFALLETLRLEDGRFRSLEAHLDRMARAAAHFGHGWSTVDVQATLAVLWAAHAEGCWRVRLTVDAAGRAQAEAHALPPMGDQPLRVVLAGRALAEARSEFVRFKTTRREHYEAFAPADPFVFDTLLWNEEGELTEFTRGNVALLIDGRWLTPAASSGLLAGVGRAHWLAEGRITEAVLHTSDLARAQGLVFFNSLRGWLPATLVPAAG